MDSVEITNLETGFLKGLRSDLWWKRWASNPRPLECHSSALPNWATSPYLWCLGWDLNPQNAGFESATYANSVTKAYLKDERVSTALMTGSSHPYILHSAYKKGKFLLYLLPKLVPSFLHAMTLSASTLPCGRYWWTWRGSNTRPPACKASALPKLSYRPI